jgi:hypothetical protein
MISKVVVLLGALVIVGIGGCSSDDTPTSPNGTSGRIIKDDPAFAGDIQKIFDLNCTSSICHGSTKSADLDLRPGAARSQLVGVTATTEPIGRVVSGDANGSYLIIKLEDRQSVGDRMPRGQSPLDNIDIQNIKNWINRGAKNN